MQKTFTTELGTMLWNHPSISCIRNRCNWFLMGGVKKFPLFRYKAGMYRYTYGT